MKNQDIIVVVGAGIAGISSVGALLDAGYSNIVWIDRKFLSGDFQNFISIPANVPTFILGGVIVAFDSFNKFNKSENNEDQKYKTKQIIDKYNASQTYKNYSDLVFINCDDIKQVLKIQTRIVRQKYSDRVTMIIGQFLKLIEKQDHYIVQTNQKDILCHKVFLSLGGKSRKLQNYKPQIQRIPLYSALSPILIENYDLTNQVIQVHGSSHSAILALLNLIKMKHPPKKIYNFVNKEFQFGELVQGMPFVNLYDGIGGISKIFGEQYVKGKYADKIQRHFNLINTPDTTKIVQAIGFHPNTFSFLSKTGSTQYQLNKFNDGKLFSEGRQIKNVFSTGVMSPEIVIDNTRPKKDIVISHVSERTKKIVNALL